MYAIFKHNTREGGFTLIELVIFSAVFLIVSIGLLTVLVSVTRINVRQSAASEVNQQSLFLLQTIQRYIEESSLVELAVDAATSTLKLRVASSTDDPTYIYLNPTDKIVYIKKTDSPSVPIEPITTDKVQVVSLTFIKRSSPLPGAYVPGHDAVSVTFAVAYNTNKVEQTFQRILSTAVTRVTAATFDSSILPSTSDALEIGGASSRWRSINGFVYFTSDNRVGIGTASPAAGYILDVNGTMRGLSAEFNGSVRVNTTGVRPSCSASTRGMLWVLNSAGVDVVSACLQTGAGYAWTNL